MRFDVGVVGTGRVGAVLGAALGAAGHTVVAASGGSDESRSRAHDLLPGVPLVEADDVVERAGLVLLAVPDEALPGLVAGLSARGRWRPGQIVVHTSARFGVGVLAPANHAQVLPLALHPAIRLSGTRVDLLRLPEASMAVTAADAVAPIGEALAGELGMEPVRVPEEDRPRYGAALRHAVDHLPVIVEQALELLGTLDGAQGRRLLATFLLTGAEEALRVGRPQRVAEVDDVDLLRSDLEILDRSSPDSRAVHLALMRATVSRAFAEGDVGGAEIDRLLDVLAAGPRDDASGGARD